MVNEALNPPEGTKKKENRKFSKDYKNWIYFLKNKGLKI